MARSVSPSKHLAFGSNPGVCYIISHTIVVFVLLISRIISTKYMIIVNLTISQVVFVFALIGIDIRFHKYQSFHS